MTTDLQKHLAQYRESEQALTDYIKSTMPYGSIVRVQCQGRYCGFCLCFGPGERPDAVAVTLENGLVWDYPIETVRPMKDSELGSLPLWLVKRMRKETK